MRKILLTGANGMLGTDFIKHFGDVFEILPLDTHNGDITNMKSMDEFIKNNRPDLILNFAAYTNVDEAEDMGRKLNFDVNTLGIYNLAKLSAQYAIDLITISTDYVFDGITKTGYHEDDAPNPINSYGIAKYLGEKLARQENPDSIIIRTSWLYGGGKNFKNFVNTMLKLSETQGAEAKKELRVINDQFGCPTYIVDLSEAMTNVIAHIQEYRGKTLHFSNGTEDNGISWFEFAQEIFRVAGKEVELIPCSSEEYLTKAKRPKCGKLLNGSKIKLRNWKDGLKTYLANLDR